MTIHIPSAGRLFARLRLRQILTSLRTRGLAATMHQAALHLRRLPAGQRFSLWVPEDTQLPPEPLLTSDTPVATVILPVYNNWRLTRRCLAALAGHPPATPFEVIVVDDASFDETMAAIQGVNGVRIVRRHQNSGFIASCCEGARVARGKYLVFLNNDTVPQPGWLDSLIGTLEENSDIGLVGAQLINSDGTLQEAGGLVFSDGTASNCGRGSSPDHPQYAYLRDVDYCSGAALAVSHSLFFELGGFDNRYAPGYYEDTDLAFSVRARGLRVVYQPAAKVMHLEGATAGRDTSHGMKSYQVRNRTRFAQKWATILQLHAAPGTAVEDIAARTADLRVLIVDSSTPEPDRDSASVRLVNLMRLLKERGADVTFLPIDGRRAGAATQRLQQLGVQVWYKPYTGSLSSWFKRHGNRFDVVIACRYSVAQVAIELAQKHAPQARFVFDTVDLHHLREQRLAELRQDALLARASEATRRIEYDLVRRSAVTLVVSDYEASTIRREVPDARVEVLSNLHETAGRRVDFALRSDLLFVGGFRHHPNVDAITWFAREVYPLVRQRLPEVKLHCVGEKPPKAVSELSDLPGVEIHGHVPELEPLLDGARVAIAPIRFGAGVKGKVNLSMAFGQPVVATSVAVEGMHLTDGENVLVADSPTAFADAVFRLYDDEALWTRLSDNGLANIRQHFSLEKGRAIVDRVIRQSP